jgi:hypothetical protein
MGSPDPFPCVSNLRLRSGERWIDLFGAFAFTVTSWGMEIVDISNLENPIVTSALPLEHPAISISVDGSYAYMSTSDCHMAIVNVTDRYAPFLQSMTLLAGVPRDMEIGGDYAYVAADTAGLLVYDVTSRASPFLAATYDTSQNVSGISIDSDAALVTSWEKIEVVDVSNPLNISQVLSLPVNGCIDIALLGNYAYARTTSPEILVFNIHENILPYPVATFKTRSVVSKITALSSDAIALKLGNCIEILDATDPQNPEISEEKSAPYGPRMVDAQGDYCFVTDRNGLWAVEISSPENPRVIGRLEGNDRTTNVFVRGAYAYVVSINRPGLQVVRVSDPSNLRLVGEYDGLTWARDVLVDSTLAYVAGYYQGLYIFNVIVPSRPLLWGHCDTPGQAEAIAIRGNKAYIADGNHGLGVVDIANRRNPRYIQGLSMWYYTWDICIEGDYAYLAIDSGGVAAVAITGQDSPRLIGIYDTPGVARSVIVNDDLLFVADGDSGIVILNVSDPETLMLEAQYLSGGFVRDICLHDDLILAADLESFFILRNEPDTHFIFAASGTLDLFSIPSNHPNPFNAFTRISYNLPMDAYVTVDIFDIQGRKIERLLSERCLAGPHIVTWDARGVTSGVYFYRITAGNHCETRSCVLLK